MITNGAVLRTALSRKPLFGLDLWFLLLRPLHGNAFPPILFLTSSIHDELFIR